MRKLVYKVKCIYNIFSIAKGISSRPQVFFSKANDLRDNSDVFLRAIASLPAGATLILLIVGIDGLSTHPNWMRFAQSFAHLNMIPITVLARENVRHGVVLDPV